MTDTELIAAGLQLEAIPKGAGRKRYFLQVAGVAQPEHGFESRQKADGWITLHRQDLDWRAGYVFRLKGLRLDIAIIDEHGMRLL